MKKINFAIILIFTPFLLFSQFKIENQDVNTQQKTSLISKDNKVLLYGLNMTNQGYRYFPINLFDGVNWVSIPSYFKEGNRIDTLEFNKSYNNVIFGNESYIWIAGSTNGFYKWNGNKLEKYFLDDNLKSIREYKSIGMDSLKNIWLTTRVILANGPGVISFYSELIKFDGINYTIVASTKDIPKHLGYGSIYVSSDNRVLVTSLTINNNLLVIMPNGDIEYKTIPTPHHAYDSLRFEQRFARVVDIYADSKNNLWFSIGRNDPSDPGLVVLRNNNKWDVYTEHNNYPLIHSSYGFPNRDSLFRECYGVTEDKKGTIWVGGAGFLNYIDENNMLVTPNIDDFLNKSTFYRSEIITDSGKEAPPSWLKFLNSSDSIATIVSELFNRDWTTQHTLGKIGESGGLVESMTSTEDGSIWIAFTHIGVLRYQPLITSVEDISVSQEINLYPQPVTSADKLINIAFENPQYVSNINIYNMNGKLIQRNKYDTQITDKIEMRLDNNDFVAGTYFAAIELKDKTIFRKFIIN